MKKILLSLFVGFGLVGCAMTNSGSSEVLAEESERFEILESQKDGNELYQVIRDNNTEVLYLKILEGDLHGYHYGAGVSITPLYNADGTLMVGE